MQLTNRKTRRKRQAIARRKQRRQQKVRIASPPLGHGLTSGTPVSGDNGVDNDNNGFWSAGDFVGVYGDLNLGAGGLTEIQVGQGQSVNVSLNMIIL